jgi:protein-disulfide isomerase
MTSNRPSGRPTSGNGVPPTSRRSARQQRLASREANRSLSRASTRGTSGSNRSFMLYTVGAVVAAVVIIGAALVLTQQPAAVKPFTGPIAPIPSVATPSGIPVDGRTLGQANAPHTMDMWEDFQCTACEAFTIDVEPQVVTNYVATGKLKLVFHDFLTIDAKKAGSTESLDAANAALCANDQGQFWPYHDWLFANQYSENSGAFTKDRLKEIAQSAGIKDLTKFNSCVDGGTHNADVQTEQGQVQSSWQGTPTLIVDGGTPISFDGTYSSVSSVIDAALGVNASPSPGASGSASASANSSASPAAGSSAGPSASAAPSPSASASAS